jgi:hypothetical protein
MINNKTIFYHPDVVRKNMITKFYGEICYMVCDQYNYTESVKGYNYSKNIRLMEKVDGQWKIVNVSAFWDYKNIEKNKSTLGE